MQRLLCNAKLLSLVPIWFNPKKKKEEKNYQPLLPVKFPETNAREASLDLY